MLLIRVQYVFTANKDKKRDYFQHEQLLLINTTVYMDFLKNAAFRLATEHFLKFSCCNFLVAIS